MIKLTFSRRKMILAVFLVLIVFGLFAYKLSPSLFYNLPYSFGLKNKDILGGSVKVQLIEINEQQYEAVIDEQKKKAENNSNCNFQQGPHTCTHFTSPSKLHEIKIENKPRFPIGNKEIVYIDGDRRFSGRFIEPGSQVTYYSPLINDDGKFTFLMSNGRAGGTLYMQSVPFSIKNGARVIIVNSEHTHYLIRYANCEYLGSGKYDCEDHWELDGKPIEIPGFSKHEAGQSWGDAFVIFEGDLLNVYKITDTSQTN